ncbi:hypothetical protein BGZ65_001466 [Modicella reniformis]|uniref:DASH complex subunit SPC19 n=1 Tax=Modicella reniformis TaxID=1440133 RepID=A0A9P6SMZ7_9FUNG|nr:hypothetical protein BGZ65_001466 [Modicella reniformis]
MDRRFSSAPFAARGGAYTGQGFGFGFGSAQESTYADGVASTPSIRYLNSSRKTLLPSNLGLPSLRRCVASLETSTRLLKSVVTRLDEATSGYPRLKTITSHTKNFELVSEQDIASAQMEVARKVEPRLFELTMKASDMITDLEEEEIKLTELVRIESDKQKQRLQRQKAARSGLSNIKKLQSLTSRKEELSKSATELDEVIEEKRREFHALLEKANNNNSNNSRSSQFGSANKRLRKNTNHESKELHQKEEDRKKEVARRNQELTRIRQKIEDKRESIRQLRSKPESFNIPNNPGGQDGFNPTVPWAMYSDHHNSLGQVLQTDLWVDSRDTRIYEDAFARVTASYLRELDSRQTKTDKELNELTRDKSMKLSQMRNLCKQLFPEENIGQTMVRVLELLVESPMSEIYYKELTQDEFPAEEERRHNLGRVVAILKQVGVVELVLETQEETNDEDEHGGEEPRRTEDQLILRIKFEDSST